MGMGFRDAKQPERINAGQKANYSTDGFCLQLPSCNQGTISIVSFLFQIRLIFFWKVWNTVAQSCHTYSYYVACGIPMWVIKMQTTINPCLKYNESMTETCSDVLKKAFHRLRGY